MSAAGTHLAAAAIVLSTFALASAVATIQTSTIQANVARAWRTVVVAIVALILASVRMILGVAL